MPQSHPVVQTRAYYYIMRISKLSRAFSPNAEAKRHLHYLHVLSIVSYAFFFFLNKTRLAWIFFKFNKFNALKIPDDLLENLLQVATVTTIALWSSHSAVTHIRYCGLLVLQYTLIVCRCLSIVQCPLNSQPDRIASQ